MRWFYWQELNHSNWHSFKSKKKEDKINYFSLKEKSYNSINTSKIYSIFNMIDMKFLRSVRLGMNRLFDAYRIDPEIYPLLILMTGSTLWAGYFYTRKFAWDMDSSQPFSVSYSGALEMNSKSLVQAMQRGEESSKMNNSSDEKWII